MTVANPAAINPGTVNDSADAFAGLIQPFMASLTSDITTAITPTSMNAANIAAAADTAIRNVPKAVASISLSIDQFDNLSMEINRREGKAL